MYQFQPHHLGHPDPSLKEDGVTTTPRRTVSPSRRGEYCETRGNPSAAAVKAGVGGGQSVGWDISGEVMTDG